jgi:hypothetical protein
VTAAAHQHASWLRLRPERLAVAGAALGVAAGLVELAVGPTIRGWVGNKQDTTRLGLATLVLSLIALAAAVSWLRRRHPTSGAQLLVAAGLVVPGLIGFTTVGRLWYAPGALLLLASLPLLVELGREPANVRATLSRSWLAGLTAILATFYIFLGATALGLAGALGVIGGLLVLVGLPASTRLPKSLRALLLVAAAVPFAALTWWSVITPLLAVLLLAIGWPAMKGIAARQASSSAGRPGASGARAVQRPVPGSGNGDGSVRRPWSVRRRG